MINLSHIPKNPGCYLFKDSKDKVIYVGKAKSLDKRVKSYFKEHEDIKTNILVSKIKDVDFVVTDSEVEALILENNLIKKFKPRYNIDLKDSKRYAYIERTDDEFPRMLVARKREGKGKFYGPFVSGMSRDYVLHALRKTFKIRTCKRLPKRRCMRFDIGLCSGPCEGHISKADYLADVKSAEMVLKGKTRGVVEILDKRMKMFSRDKEFERALEIREQIRSVKELGDRQKMERDKTYDEDFINWIVHDGTVYLILFNARKGILENKQSFEFEWTPNFLEEFLVQFYSDYDVPREVVLPVNVDSGLKNFLKDKGARVVVPKVGEKMKLLELVKKNVEIAVFGDSDKIKDLRDKLNLNFLPRVIECFDVSHLNGTDVVASMVQFRDGKADKSNYRKFRIRGGDVNDDYAAMSEVVRRRYSRLVRGSGLEVGSKEQVMPDLIVVDGGKGQLGVVLDVLEELRLKIPVLGIAKREEEVFLPGRSSGVKLDRRGKALKLLIEIRDEAHRFAIAYQRLLRSKKLRE
ncbi:excinuclease ABC subunit C [archaeon]|jgi:excinuclease ABC subunit C|nr:excinuclease ABC subunit C [archaeon]MBT7128582.1 excinuclease ABC subunit C [archaeon]